MSFWGATVITNLFSAFPYVGDSIVTCYGRLLGRQSDVEPLLLAALSAAVRDRGVVVLHVWALHVAGQNNPAGVEARTEKDTLPFTPTDHQGYVRHLVLPAVLRWFIFYMPNYLGDADNYIPANPGVTLRISYRSVLSAVLRDLRSIRTSSPA